MYFVSGDNDVCSYISMKLDQPIWITLLFPKLADPIMGPDLVTPGVEIP